ncbi:MAG TPA: SAM-dependent chlorinase/fluorinase [Povalibacter sp.]|uniref:SAM hydrolase/SAM-dependent halogenase family protein n=1 Tax=Povalibacter sp. TaxID=1962978 RepID=UPI002BD66CD2|nr:SAM-dependent chlorinase/fluorinase [Povalibacter sp.]HMN43249.1 SAM-dependent chlorinase/fluorinase [Povalibacter sp.]
MFAPSGVITITTDFGHQGPFVATMKGRMLARLPDARIIDVTHEVPVYWPAEAGFWLSRSYQYFPAGTVHVAVVDPGVGTNRDIIAVEADGHGFLAPDNGLLAPVVNRAASARICRLDLSRIRQRLQLPTPSATFHGRDIFAPVAAEMAAGRIAMADLGPATTDIVPAWVDEPTSTPEQVSGVIITIDHFGNLISNIDASLIERFSHAVVRTAGHSFPLRRTYGDVKPGEYLALINSFGVVELARAEQSAADGLGLGRGAPVVVSNR